MPIPTVSINSTLYDTSASILTGRTSSNGLVAAQIDSEGHVKVSSSGFVSSASMTRPNDTTPYTALDVCGTSPAANIEFAGINSVSGGHVVVTGFSLRVDVAAVPSGMGAFRLHLFDAAPTAIADNAAMSLISADRSKYLGYIETTTPIDLGDTLWSRTDNLNFKVKLASASTSIFGVLQTVAGFTPTAQTVKTIRLSGFSV